MHLEIFTVTGKIQNGFPELYELLSETPVSITCHNKEIQMDDYREYLETIHIQFTNFEEMALKKRVKNISS